MEWILNMNITVAIVVPCVVVVRKIFIYRIPGRTWLLLWKILILRLLCPFTFELQLKSVNVSRNVASVLQLQEKIKLPGDDMLLSSAYTIMTIVWLIGVIVVAGILISSHLIKRRLYCMAIPVKGEYYEEWKRSHSLTRKVEIKESDRIAVPLTYGLIRPVILLPTHRSVKERSLEFVLEHEFIHIKHLDVLLKWILVLICSIYWYNPLIWVMYFFVNRDIELSCDEALLKHQTLGYRKEYLNVLIDLEEKKAERDILCSSFCKCPIEERIRVMVKTEKEKPKSIILSLLIVCLITILNIATTAKAEMGYSYDGSKADVIKHNEVSREVPNIISYDEDNACEILWKQGFSYIIR